MSTLCNNNSRKKGAYYELIIPQVYAIADFDIPLRQPAQFGYLLSFLIQQYDVTARDGKEYTSKRHPNQFNSY